MQQAFSSCLVGAVADTHLLGLVTKLQRVALALKLILVLRFHLVHLRLLCVVLNLLDALVHAFARWACVVVDLALGGPAGQDHVRLRRLEPVAALQSDGLAGVCGATGALPNLLDVGVVVLAAATEEDLHSRVGAAHLHGAVLLGVVREALVEDDLIGAKRKGVHTLAKLNGLRDWKLAL